MESIANYMTAEHRKCDGLYADFENAVLDKNREKSIEYFNRLAQDTERHLKKEEEILFPAFEQATGSQMGPTQVMRMEHTQIRQMLSQIDAEIKQDNSKRIHGMLETLMILFQQHNMKEEQMLYPMTDRALAAQSEDIINSMNKI